MFSNNTVYFSTNLFYNKNMKAYKPYLCQCGETNPLKFYARMKSRCYACHKKRYKDYYKRDKSKEIHRCECGETKPKEFFQNYKSKCKKCTYEQQKKATKSRPHKEIVPKYTCKYCGKTGKENFYRGMFFRCTECFNRQTTLRYYPFYLELVEIQGGEKCAICKKTPQELRSRRLAVDHDHESNLVRGLLCSACNFILGQVSLNMAKNLMEYLQNPPAKYLQIQFPEKMKHYHGKSK